MESVLLTLYVPNNLLPLKQNLIVRIYGLT